MYTQICWPWKRGFPWLLEMEGFGAQTAESHNLNPATITLNASIEVHIIQVWKGQLKKWFPSCKAIFQATCSTLMQDEKDAFTWISLLCQKPGIQQASRAAIILTGEAWNRSDRESDTRSPVGEIGEHEHACVPNRAQLLHFTLFQQSGPKWTSPFSSVPGNDPSSSWYSWFWRLTVNHIFTNLFFFQASGILLISISCLEALSHLFWQHDQPKSVIFSKLHWNRDLASLFSSSSFFHIIFPLRI